MRLGLAGEGARATLTAERSILGIWELGWENGSGGSSDGQELPIFP